MAKTDSAIVASLDKFKRTKIIATLGPATDSYEQILDVIKAGANGIRLNFSHGGHEERVGQIANVRKAAKAVGVHVAVIADLQGPKIRLGEFEGVYEVSKGQVLQLAYGADLAKTGILPMQYDLSSKVKKGERLYLNDGKVRAIIEKVEGKTVFAVADNAGQLTMRKSSNLPDTNFGGDTITEKDIKDLDFIATQDVDYIAQSFVQTAEDLRAMRKLMLERKMNAKLIVKFETQVAVDHMDEVVREADVVMVARGDLAVETPAENVPIVQRQLVKLGLKYAKPTIIATQMLLSMTDRPEPTRAEVSDVATAVFIGADCVMLSDETAMGSFPLDAVKTMARVLSHTEQNAPMDMRYEGNAEERTTQAAISSGVISLAQRIGARAIVAETHSGATALQISCRRPNMPIVAVTGEERTAGQLALAYGVQPHVRPADKQAATKLTDWLRENDVLAAGDIIVTASGQYPGVVGTTDTIKVRVLE
jgi:pyruvate kinase